MNVFGACARHDKVPPRTTLNKNKGRSSEKNNELEKPGCKEIRRFTPLPWASL